MSSTLEEMIKKKLQSAFHPITLEVMNESHLHAGHQRHKDSNDESTFEKEGETHFRIKITAKAFTTMSLIDQHRAIYHLLADELQNGLHALALETSAPNKVQED